MAGKDVGYFPHYINARNDRKIRKARLQLGIESYAIYFMTLEVLREQKDYKYPLADLDILSDDFGTTLQKIQVIVLNYGLFDIDPDEQFFSPAQKLAMLKFDQTKEINRLKGIKSGEARRKKLEEQVNELKQLENFSQPDSTKPQFDNGSTTDEQVSKKVNKEVSKKYTYTKEDWLNDYCLGKPPAYKAVMRKKLKANDPEAILAFEEWKYEKEQSYINAEEERAIEEFDYTLIEGMSINGNQIVKVVIEKGISTLHVYFDDGSNNPTMNKEYIYGWYQSKIKEETAC